MDKCEWIDDSYVKDGTKISEQKQMRPATIQVKSK